MTSSCADVMALTFLNYKNSLLALIVTSFKYNNE